MPADWWCTVNTLHFSAEQFLKPTKLASALDWFKREVGVTDDTKLFLNIVLLNLASQAVATVWCRRGTNFIMGWVKDGELLRQSRAAYCQLGFPLTMEQTVAFRMCLGLQMTANCVDWGWLFTVYQQWYDGQVAFTNSDLQNELQNLSIVIQSPSIPGLSCTFNPWTLVFDNGEATFNYK